MLKYTNEIIKSFFMPFADQLKFLAIHGSYVYKSHTNPKDIDIIAVFDNINSEIIDLVKEIHNKHRVIHIIPYSEKEIEVFPSHNTMQFFMFADVILGSIKMEPPKRSDLIYHLKIRLSDNIIIKGRNAFLSRGRNNINSIIKVLPEIQKDIYWWWRNFFYISHNKIIVDNNELSRKISHQTVKQFLLYRLEEFPGQEYRIMQELEECISCMVDSLKELESSHNDKTNK